MSHYEELLTKQNEILLNQVIELERLIRLKKCELDDKKKQKEETLPNKNGDLFYKHYVKDANHEQ